MDFIKTISGNSISEARQYEGEILISKLSKFNVSKDSAHFSLKVVTNGTEVYKVNGNSYNVDSNSFLIVNPDSEIELNVEQENTMGVCLFPSAHFVQDVFRNKVSSEKELLDNPFDISDLPNFTEKKHRFGENLTGNFLSHHMNHLFSKNVSSKNFDSNRFYHQLCENMILDQVAIEQLLKSLNSSKKSTKEELYRRVDTARMFIEDNFTEKINLDELARNAFLSKYHFTRSFKSIYNLSPIQYLLQLRLNKAAELLEKDYSYSDVSFMVGFSDVKNLRKALKRRVAA